MTLPPKDDAEFRYYAERELDELDRREHILGSIEAMRDMDAEDLYDAIDAVSRDLLDEAA